MTSPATSPARATAAAASKSTPAPLSESAPPLEDVSTPLEEDVVLFDGHDKLFKEIVQDAKLYGEYGCGASTKWVFKNTTADVLSVDTSATWIDHVKESLDPAMLERAQLKHVYVGELADWGRPTSYFYRENFPSYTNAIWEQDQRPDVVLIDGRFRVCAFLSSLKFADEGCKIIFDDYLDRPFYHVVERFAARQDVCGRQCLFIVPKKETIDFEELEKEINNFRLVFD